MIFNFDIQNLDFSKELSQQLIDMYRKKIKDGEGFCEPDVVDDIIVYHGTCLPYANFILKNGIEPRKKLENGNFDKEIRSFDGMVYLTTKWHYLYAHNSCVQYDKKEPASDSIINAMCYFDCRVNLNELCLDEDFFHSAYVLSKIKKCLKEHRNILTLSSSECLQYYGTVASNGKISRERIVGLTILLNQDKIFKNFISASSQYQKDVKKWAHGKGKGALSKKDLLLLEDDENNLFYDVSKIKSDYIIDKIVYNTEAKKYVLLFKRLK